jgi:hypothetical protein
MAAELAQCRADERLGIACVYRIQWGRSSQPEFYPRRRGEGARMHDWLPAAAEGECQEAARFERWEDVPPHYASSEFSSPSIFNQTQEFPFWVHIVGWSDAQIVAWEAQHATQYPERYADAKMDMPPEMVAVVEHAHRVLAWCAEPPAERPPQPPSMIDGEEPRYLVRYVSPLTGAPTLTAPAQRPQRNGPSAVAFLNR